MPAEERAGLSGHTDLLFAYGSLMRGEAACESLLQATERLGTGLVVGFALYDLGDYPGMYPRREGRVEGELFRMADPASTLARLDAYEDAPRLYRRAIVAVAGPEGEVPAWAYVLTQDPAGRHPLIPEGHWPRHRRKKTARP